MGIFLENPSHPVFLLSCVCLSLMVLPFCLIIFMLSFFFKHLLNIVLKTIYGDKYLGMLSGSDALWITDIPQRMAIDSMLLLKIDAPNSEVAVDKIKTRVLQYIMNHKERFSKCSSTLHYLLGYGYMVQRNLTANELTTVIRVDKTTSNYSQSFSKIWSDFANKPFPSNNFALVSFAIIDACKEWKVRNNFDENHYPLLMRLHHAIGDGMTLIAATASVLADEKVDFIKTIEKVMKSKYPSITKSTIKKFHLFLKMLLMAPGYFILMKLFIDMKSSVPFDAPMATGRRNLHISVQDEALAKVWRIKRSVGKANFMEIMTTAVSASLEEYFEVSNVPVPDEMMFATPLVLVLPNKDSDNIELKGDITLSRYPMPVRFNSRSLLARLEEVIRRGRPTANGPDTTARYLLINYLCEYIPASLTMRLDCFDYSHVAFSNLPGIPKITACNGTIEVDDVYYMPPNIVKVGIFGCFFTYNNKFHIGISVNDKVFPSMENSQNLIPNIFKYIDMMDAEISKRT